MPWHFSFFNVKVSRLPPIPVGFEPRSDRSGWRIRLWLKFIPEKDSLKQTIYSLGEQQTGMKQTCTIHLLLLRRLPLFGNLLSPFFQRCPVLGMRRLPRMFGRDFRVWLGMQRYDSTSLGLQRSAPSPAFLIATLACYGGSSTVRLCFCLVQRLLTTWCRPLLASRRRRREGSF
jgi:hypothetical protein